jgi:hypothetical protein
MFFLYVTLLIVFFGVSSVGSITYAQTLSSDKPQLKVSLSCQVGSPIIPASFNASKFPPNVHVGIVIQKLNESNSNTSVASQFKGFHNDMTDATGNINGAFNIDTSIGPHRSYSLQVFTDSNRDDLPDSPLELASSPIEC